MSWEIETLLAELQEAYRKEGGALDWPSEHVSVKAALEHFQAILTYYKGERVLGVGGSGIAIRLNDEKFPAAKKALKFPRPVGGKIEFIAEMLEKEIDQLSDLRHRGIVRIIDYGVAPQIGDYDRLPYYIMDFVDGASSDAFVLSPDLTGEQFHRLLVSTAETLDYLHAHPPAGVAHLDLKPDNIMVDASGSAVMIDLGTCKQLDAGDTNTVVSVTKSFAHPKLVQQLAADPTDENRSRGELARSAIDPEWDLWSFGLTLLHWLGLDFNTGEPNESGIYGRLEAYTRKFYLLLAARLLVYSPEQWLLQKIGLPSGFVREFPVKSSAALVDQLRRLDGSSNPLRLVPELQEGRLQTFQAGPDLHVPLTPRLESVLGSEPLRRLNSISQLGLVSQVYIGAKHTRREHSLGTYAHSRRFLTTLYNDPYSPLFRQIVSKDDCVDVLLTALLHDTGQFPLAHDLEDIAPNIFDHDDLSKAILRGRWDKRKKGSRPIEMPPIADVLDAWGTTGDRVEAIMTAKSKSTSSGSREKLLRSVISSAIDADKMDYLLRDSRHTDVPYPEGIDVDRLYRSLTVVVVKQKGGAKPIPTIGVHAKGKVAAEFLTWARYAMFSQVYWHHAVRSQKAMLSRAVSALLVAEGEEAATAALQSDFVEFVMQLPTVLYQHEPDEPPAPTLFAEVQGNRPQVPDPSGVPTELPPTDAATLLWLRSRLREHDRKEEELISGILHRDLFKRLWVLSHSFSENQWDRVVRGWDRLQAQARHRANLEFEKAISRHVRRDGLVTVTEMKAQEADKLLQEWTAAEIPWLLIDVPGGRPGSDIGLHYVLEGQRRALRKNDRAVGEEIESQVWDRYARNLREEAGKIRIFCHPTVADVLEESVSLEEGVEILSEVLENAYL